ncbi:hypothetical protein O181_011245 [Austropuccinia psidii MF-1]|uniref:Uncharacterized protein n=1 Tax=Austropuccinia psidii MF-1 TaxID=1389203 RepID=A0A9Q3BUS2_9BASI|nr:hypothetical protein [Austropuccinia psidii MF-1]
MPEPDTQVSTSANVQGVLLSHIEDFGDIFNYHSNITQESLKRGLDNINSIYKIRWDNLPTNDSDTFLPVGIKVSNNQELEMLAWLEELEIAWLDFFNATETKEFLDNNIGNLKLMKESAKPPDNLPKSEHSFLRMVQGLLYPFKPIKHFWANVLFESISLVPYNIIAPKPYVAPTTTAANPLRLNMERLNQLPLAWVNQRNVQHNLALKVAGLTMRYQQSHTRNWRIKWIQ